VGGQHTERREGAGSYNYTNAGRKPARQDPIRRPSDVLWPPPWGHLLFVLQPHYIQQHWTHTCLGSHHASSARFSSSLHLTSAVRKCHPRLRERQPPRLLATHLPCRNQRRRRDRSTPAGQKHPASPEVLCDRRDRVGLEGLVVPGCRFDFLLEVLRRRETSE